MPIIFVTVLPVFALMGLGYIAAQRGLISQDGAKAFSQFVFLFAIPALLFRTMVYLETPAVSPWTIWLAFFVPAMLVWLITVPIASQIPSLKPTNGAAAGMGAAFGNLVMLGLPLVLSHFGEAAALPAALIISIHTPIHWMIATLLAEWSGRGLDKPPLVIFWDMIIALLKNPLVFAVLAGLAWSWTGLGLNPVVDRTIEFLGDAAIPAALFAMGLSLSQLGFAGNLRGMIILLILKLLIFPLIAAVFLLYVFDLPPVWAGVVLVFAALPPGINAYLFAQQYNASIGPVSGCIAIGTALSIVTISVLLALIGPA